MNYKIGIVITPKSKDKTYSVTHKYYNIAHRTTIEGCKNYIDSFVSKHKRDIFKVTGRKTNFFYSSARVEKKFYRTKNTGKKVVEVFKEIKL